MNRFALCNPARPVALAALAALVLALALPGIRSVPVTDRDEARYAQASKQMAESGDYVQIRFLDEARNKKPAGIYWLHTLSVRLTGIQDQIWPYRLVSVVGALLAVWLVYLLARRLQPAAPLLPAAALAACPLLVAVSHAATTDAVLAATVCAAQLCLANVYLGTRPAAASTADLGQTVAATGGRGTLLAALGFWIALGIGILVKGPITPSITGLTILGLWLVDRNARWLRGLRPALGVPLLLLIVLPWLLAIQHATHGVFLQESLGQDFANKMKGAQESHGAPPGVYLATAGILLWPLFPLAWRGIGRAWQARRSDPAAAFLLAWLIPSWLVFELAPTKLPHYVLPLYPALAFLAIREMRSTTNGNTPVIGRISRIWGTICWIVDCLWWLAAAAFVIGPPLAARLLGGQWLPAAFACSTVAAFATVWLWRRQRAALQSPGWMVAGAVGFALLYFPLLFAGVAPQLDDLWLTRKVAALVAQETHGKPARILSLGYNEPSVAFVFGTQTRFVAGADDAARALAQDPTALVLVQDAPTALPQLLPMGQAVWTKLTAAMAVLPKHLHRQVFLDAAARAGVTVREAGFADGLNYSRTKRVRVILYRNAECGVRGAE